MSKCHEYIEGLWRIWGKMLPEGRDPCCEHSVVLGGLVLRFLHPVWAPSNVWAPHPNSWSSAKCRSSWSIFLQFFSSSAMEKIYFCLLETEYEVTFLHQGRRDGSSPCDLWRSHALPLPCHRRHLWQDWGNSSFSLLSDSAAECARPAPAETSFSPLSSFSLSLLTLGVLFSQFTFWSRAACLGVAVAVVCKVGAQSWQPREIHRISAFDGLSLGLPAGIWCWETNLSLGCHPDFVIYWSERELWKRLPVSRAVWQLLHRPGMLAG